MYYRYSNIRPFSILKGMTLTAVERNGDEAIRFINDKGQIFEMGHSNDCCESVSIESVTGDLQDLVGTPILLAEDVSYGDRDKAATLLLGPKYEYDESYTWTFYKLATIKGYVDIRWYGTSNGYYSESVDLYEMLPEEL